MSDIGKVPPATAAHAAKPGRLERLRAATGVDFHIAVTLAFRGWSILAGAATMLLLPLWLTPVQQGYYYTFASVLALQVFFELGLNQIVVQLVSHEVAHLEMRDDGRLEGDPLHLDRLGSLAQLMRRWYRMSAAVFALVTGTVGAAFFEHKGTLGTSAWLGAWGLLTCAFAYNLFLSPGLAMMEGAGQVGQVARLRLFQSMIGYVGLWIALYLGAGLWAAAAAPLAGAIGTSSWLRARGRLLRDLSKRRIDLPNRVLWKRDVFPLQWRIALSWASGWFIFNAFTPLVFAHQGAVEAGRLGLAMTIFTAVSTIGMSWINARTAQLTMLISRCERAALDKLFVSMAARSCAVTAALSVCVVLGDWILSMAGVRAMSRIATLEVLCYLAWVTIVNSVIFAAATYMRAHREEPMLPIALATGLLTAAVAWLGSRHGVANMMQMYAAVTTFISLPWTLVIFRRYFKRGDLP